LPSGDIVDLNSLEVLDLRDNDIAGDLPIAAFIYLRELLLDGNNFNSVPVGFLAGARKLQVFSISNCSHLMDWELPNDPRQFGSLRAYTADNAHVSGTLSSFLGNSSYFPGLSRLSLSNNLLTGEVPAAFASGTLTHLDLSYNSLTGPVDFIANLPQLVLLRLAGNGFTGPLPDFSGHWSLTVVDVAHNHLTGVVPASLVELEGLSTVSIRGNLLQGRLPEFATSVQTDTAEAASDGSFCRPEPGPCDKRVQSLVANGQRCALPGP
jgi:Leucine-rich repeat (LRR) protein